MSAINLNAVVEGVRDVLSRMDLEDASYYSDAADKFTMNLLKFGSNPGVRNVNYHDLFAQQEVRALNSVNEENDLQHKTAMFIGICDTASNEGSAVFPVDNGEDTHHDSLADHVLSNVMASQKDPLSADKLSDSQVAEFNERIEEIRTFKGSQPSFVINRWKARNNMGERLNIGHDVDAEVIGRIDQAIKGAVQRKSVDRKLGENKPSLTRSFSPG